MNKQPHPSMQTTSSPTLRLWKRISNHLGHKNVSNKKAKAFGLIESLLVSVAILLAVVGIYRFYQQVYAAESAHQESQNTLEMTNRIMKAYGPMANFSGLSTSALVQQGIVPATMEVDSGKIMSSFGGEVLLSSESVNGVAGAGFSITYQDVPRKVCSSLVGQVNKLDRYHSIAVVASPSTSFGTSNVVATDGTIDASNLAAQCAQAASLNIKFVYERQNTTDSFTQLEPCQLPSPSSETRTQSCTSGYAGQIQQERHAVCSDAYGLPTWTDWADTSNTCEVICAPDPSSPQTQTTSCPSGYVGSITQERTSTCPTSTGYPVWSDWAETSNTCALACVVPAPEQQTIACPTGYTGSQTQQRTATCPDPTGSPVWGAWSTISSSCDITCVVPSPSTQTQWVSASGACTTGYTGTQTWEKEQTRSASCPAATGSPAWSDWTDTGSIRNVDTSGCTSTCVPDSPLTQWVSTSGACPAGYAGSKTWEKEQSRTSTCSAGATSPTTSSWVDTGQTRNLVDNCTPASCNVGASTYKSWAVNGNACYGYVGPATVPSGSSITATDSSNPTTGSASFTCTNGTLSGAADPGATCDQSCSLSSGTITWSSGTASCSANMASQTLVSGASYTLNDTTSPSTGVGSITYTCNNGTVTSSSNCARQTTCFNLLAQNVSWTVNGATCTATIPANTSVSSGNSYAVSDSTAPTTGAASFSCYAGDTSLSNSPDAGATCVGTCGAAPADDTRSYAGCASGYYGSWTQSNPYESSVYPTCWSQTTNTWSPSTAPNGSCTACPAPSTENLTQWVSRSDTCPAGQSGSITYEAEQSGTRSVSYSCPAGTSTLPSPTYGSTTWTDTGNTRNTVNTCAAASCSLSSGTKTWNQGGLALCSGSVPTTQTIASGSSYTVIDDSGPAMGIGTLTYSCTNGTLSQTPVCYIPCSVGTGKNFTWTVNGVTCNYSASTAAAVVPGEAYTATDSTTPTTGSADFACTSDGAQLSTTPNAGATCVGTCGAAPADDTRTYAGCAAGYYGTWTQSNPYESSAYPTCWSQTTNTWSPSTAPNGACTSCPADSTQTQTQWVSRSDTCPVGQIGSITYEAEQSRSRSVSYSCPANTASLPAPTYGTYSAWVDTGTTRNTVNTCGAPAGCTLTSGIKSWTGTGTSSCSANLSTSQSMNDGDTYTVSDNSTVTTGKGSITYVCNNGTINVQSSSCFVPCRVLAGDAYSWQAGGFACDATAPTGVYVDPGTSYAIDDTSSPYTGSATFSCPAGSSGASVSTTANAGATCISSNCNTAGKTYTWTVNGNTCTYTSGASSSIGTGTSYSVGDSTDPAVGSASFLCTDGVLATTPNAGATCSLSCTVAAGTTATWTVNGVTCDGPAKPTTQTIQSGTYMGWSDTTFPSRGSANFTCTEGVLASTPNAGATCANSCNVTAGTTRTWTVNGNTCTYTFGATVYADGAVPTVTDSTAPATGSAGFLCSGGDLSATPQAGATCQTQCTASTTDVMTWSVGSYSCSASPSSNQLLTSGQSFSVTDSSTGGGGNLSVGSATYTCGSDGTFTASNTTCAVPCRVSAGTSFSWSQSNTCSASSGLTATIVQPGSYYIIEDKTAGVSGTQGTGFGYFYCSPTAGGTISTTADAGMSDCN